MRGISKNKKTEIYTSAKNLRKPKPKFELNSRWIDNLIPKDVLYDLYINKKYSITRIAKSYNTTTRTIKRRLFYFDVPIRTWHQQMKFRKMPSMKGHEFKKIDTSEIEAYFKAGLTMHEIKGKTGLSLYMIRNRLQRLGYETTGNAIQSLARPEARYDADLGHIVRSSWEQALCSILKSNGIEYQYEPVTLKVNRLEYTPDIKVRNILIEVKGNINYPNGNSQKFENAKALYPEYRFFLVTGKNCPKGSNYFEVFTSTRKKLNRPELKRLLNEITESSQD